MFTLAFRLALSHLLQRPFARITLILSVSSILVLNAAVFLFFKGVSNSLKDVQSSRYLTAYIEPQIELKNETFLLSAIRKVPGVNSAELISKDAFIEKLSKHFPQLSEELSKLDTEGVPRYIKVKTNNTESNALDQLATKVKNVGGIDFVELNKQKYAGIIGAFSSLRMLALFLFFGTSFALLNVLINHFRLGAGFQYQVKRTLSYLGARKSYIWLPFLIEGVVEGVVAGAIGAGVILLFGHRFQAQFNHFFGEMVYQPFHFEFTLTAAVVLAVGIISGLIGSSWSLFKVKG